MMVGRMLFHASGDVRISSDGRACASCHPDGRDDAITWATPEGPRRSIMLAGRLGKTAPYSWNGDAATVEAHLGSTFQRLRGDGLRNFELGALVAYVSSLPAPPPRAIEDKTKVERGRRIFTSTETGCSSCHAGPSSTDGMNHDVGSKHVADRAEKFNTPSLRFIGGTGPYFHDGRYATLGELLRKSDGKMGRTKHLTNADLDALQSYLETL
jgi:cytochrome c peroxidase